MIMAMVVSDEQRVVLESMVRSQTIDVRAARRSRIVLLASEGMGDREIARQLGIGRIQAARWRGRFAEGGVAAIQADLPRSGRKPRIDAAEIVRLTTQSTPEGATHWSTRKLVAKLGISDTTVFKVWRANGLKPHLVETFKVSRDPKFVEKLEDIVGLYMSPPEHALVLCCDEKSQVQALDRTQPGLPLKRGRAATMTHDYKRHGTTTLIAAMSTLDGTVISRCAQRHRHTEWLDFLRQIDRETPKGKELHLVCDNYATHKHPVVKAWLEKHPRFQPPLPGSTWSSASSAVSPRTDWVAASSAAFPNWSPPSRSTSPRTIRIRNHSFGPPRPMTFSRKSSVLIAGLVPRKTKHYTSKDFRAIRSQF